MHPHYYSGKQRRMGLNKIRSTEIKLFRSIQGCTIWDNIRNEDIKRELYVWSISYEIAEYRQTWTKHLSGMGRDRYPKVTLSSVQKEVNDPWEGFVESDRGDCPNHGVKINQNKLPRRSYWIRLSAECNAPVRVGFINSYSECLHYCKRTKVVWPAIKQSGASAVSPVCASQSCVAYNTR